MTDREIINRLRERHGKRMSEHDDDVMAVVDALAVFEKAHTPTDDEREAHRRVIDLWFANWRSIGKVSPAMEVAIDSLEGMVSDALDAGSHRSEVPEPSAERCFWCDRASTGGAVWQGDGKRYPSCGGDGHGALFTPSEPQGEPSDTKIQNLRYQHNRNVQRSMGFVPPGF